MKQPKFVGSWTKDECAMIADALIILSPEGESEKQTLAKYAMRDRLEAEFRNAANFERKVA